MSFLKFFAESVQPPVVPPPHPRSIIDNTSKMSSTEPRHGQEGLKNHLQGAGGGGPST